MLSIRCERLYCELYRIALEEHGQHSNHHTVMAQAPAHWLVTIRDLCFQHASNLVEKLCLVRDYIDPDGLRIFDPTLPMHAYVATTILVRRASIQPISPSKHEELKRGFEVVLSFVESCAVYLETARSVVRKHVLAIVHTVLGLPDDARQVLKMKRLLRQHGYIPSTGYETSVIRVGLLFSSFADGLY
jgi:hypothetical protein